MRRRGSGGSRVGAGRGRPAFPLPALLLLALPFLAPAPACAQAKDPAADLQRVERELSAGARREAELAREAQRQTAELGALRARLIEATDHARRAEIEVADAEAKLAILEAQEREQAARLEEDRARVARLLEALVRVSRVPPEALLASPETPLDAYRSARLMGAAVPELRAQAEGLRAALDRFAELRRSVAERRAQALASREAVSARRAELAGLLSAREAALGKADAERRQAAQRVASLAAEARDLKGLIDRLETERRNEAERRRQEAEARAAAEAAKAEEERRRAEQARESRRQQAAVVRPPGLPEREGRTPLPVIGKVLTRYGEADRLGVTSRGLTIQASPGATVASPFDGSVMFAGPFRGYGLILIVEHANGYHSLIAGLGRIDARVGQQVLAGEPVGTMAATEASPDLYFELRRNGQPINPQRGIAAPDGKGQG